MNDEKMILYFYNDGLSRSERREIEETLRRDPELARRYEALVRDLEGLDRLPEVDVPEGLADRLSMTVHRAARLEQAARAERPKRFHGWSVALGGAITAAMAIGLGIGLWLGGEGPAPTPMMNPTTTVTWSPAAFERGVQAHFRSSRSSLADLPAGDGSERAALIAGLLQQNRDYAELAIQNDAADVARVLRSFDTILVRMADESLSPEDADALRAQLEFEMNVVLTRLMRESSERSTATT